MRSANVVRTEDDTALPKKTETLFEIEHSRFGIEAIVKINAIAEVKEAELENGTREERQREIATALRKPIRIFPEGELSLNTYLPLPKWFIRRTRCLALFPPLLDSLLIAEDDARFGKTDADVRELVERFSSLFTANLNAYLRCKQSHLKTTLQLFEAISVFAMLAFLCLRLNAFGTLSSGMIAGIFAFTTAGLALVAAITISWYRHNVGDVYAHIYLPALKNTAFKTSEFISGRLNSFSNRFEEYIGKIDSLLPHGEKNDGIDSNKRDNSYKSGKVFLWTQMLMWLPARVERIEALLRYKMALLTIAHAEADYRGFLATFRLGAVYAIIPVLAIIEGLTALVHPWFFHFSTHTVFMCLVQLWIASITLAYVGYVSYLAYYKKEWNTPKYVFKDYLDSDQWFVSQKYNLSTRIPARIEKAFDEIDHKDKQIGNTPG